MLLRVANIKFHKNPSNGSRGKTRGRTNGETDMTKLTGDFPYFTKRLLMISNP